MVKKFPKTKVSAVLIPLILNKDNELEVLLTVRHSNVSLHQGEVCLPGGKYERKDANAVETALRECREEIGLLPDNIVVIDVLNDICFPSKRGEKKYIVFPVIGLVKESFYAKLNVHEVCDVFTYPFNELLSKPDILNKWSIPCIVQKGIVTGQSYNCYGLTFIILLLSAVSFYKKLPHEDSLMFFSRLKYIKGVMDMTLNAVTAKL